MKKILIICGPNLNQLEKREPGIYPPFSLEEIKKYTEKELAPYKLELEWFQSDYEGDLIKKSHEASAGKYDLIVINPGGLSHSSVALLDALLLIKTPIIEVHFSRPSRREHFRRNLLTGESAKIIMEGLGKDAFYLAIYSQVRSNK